MGNNGSKGEQGKASPTPRDFDKEFSSLDTDEQLSRFRISRPADLPYSMQAKDAEGEMKLFLLLREELQARLTIEKEWETTQREEIPFASMDISDEALSQDAYKRPAWLKKVRVLHLTNNKRLSTLPQKVISGFSDLEMVSLQDVEGTGITEIESFAISSCPMLRHISLKAFRDVTVIHLQFLFGCGKLERVDFAPLAKVKTLGDGFLSSARSLRELDLTPLTSLSGAVPPPGTFSRDKHWEGVLPNNFCNGLDRICRVQFPAAWSGRFKAIGSQFFYDAKNLEEIDLSAFTGVELVGTWFLKDCAGLKVVDLSPLCKLTRIEESFLEGCSSLAKIDFQPLSNVTHIRDRFMSGCKGIQEVDFTPLAQLECLGNYFMNSCALEEVDLAPFRNVTKYPFGKGDADIERICKPREKHNFFTYQTPGLKRIKNCPRVLEYDISYHSKAVEIHFA